MSQHKGYLVQLKT